jgi:adenylate cyclase
LPDEPRLAALIGVITERRFDARQDATRFLRSPRHGSLVLQALAALQTFPTENVGAVETTALPVGRANNAFLTVADGGTVAEVAVDSATLICFAANRLRRLRKKVLALAAAARIDDPRSLHALRIGIKRLRYALEFFTPLAAAKSLRRMLAQLASLQDTLGQINDLANAGERLMDCAADDPRLREAVTLIGGWHGPRHQKLLAEIPVGLKHLGKLRLPRLAAG